LSVPLASIATAEPEPELDDAAGDPDAPASAEPDAEAEPDASADPDAAAEPDDAAELDAVAALADAAPPWPPDAPGEPFWFEEQPARTRIRRSATGGRRSRRAAMESFLGRRCPHQVLRRRRQRVTGLDGDTERYNRCSEYSAQQLRTVPDRRWLACSGVAGV